ncbi:MAG TPA: ribonuclease III [Kofleriaceae bacterium]|nr:ribonuclease III [Kofleriaceae bacterium]
MNESPTFEELEQRLGYQFRDRELLTTALTHRSYANEHVLEGRSDNEKLEYLGDAVLDLVVGHMLMNRYPEAREGELSVTRAQVVSEAGLAEVAHDLELGRWLFLGKGEDKSGGRYKPSLLADAFEAVLAAVYLDGGFDAAWGLIGRLFPGRLERVELTGYYDHKTRLQERAQALLKEAPVYEIVAEFGPDHAKVFEVAVSLRGREWARAQAGSKKYAEQLAAASAAFLLDGADLTALDDEEE